MEPLFNKVLFELLPEDQQPKKSIFAPNGDSVKNAKVISVGETVTFIKKDDIIQLYANDIMGINSKLGYCIDTNAIFINRKPQPNKTHIRSKKSEELSKFNKADIISSSSSKLKEGDEIGFKKGNGLILPDGSEIISNTQIYFKS